jgi:hypothetical protein
MSEWIDFIHWQECKAMERPGYIFEVVNADEQQMLTTCTAILEVPFDWTSLPVKFRLIVEPALNRSDPLPPPVQK